MAWTKEECEADACRSHLEAVDSEIVVSSLEMFLDGAIKQHVPKPPWRARVLETPTDFLLVWSGDYLDARWYIEPVDPTDGIEGATGFWIYDPISWLVGVGRE